MCRAALVFLNFSNLSWNRKAQGGPARLCGVLTDASAFSFLAIDAAHAALESVSLATASCGPRGTVKTSESTLPGYPAPALPVIGPHYWYGHARHASRLQAPVGLLLLEK